MGFALEVENLNKTFQVGFKKTPVLEDISFTVKEGEIYGFLGSNGAGKTTSIKIIMGLIKATSGQVRIQGVDANDAQARQNIAYLPEHPQFPRNIKAGEFLHYCARLGKSHATTDQVKNILSRVGIPEVYHRRVDTFSKGMQQRLGIAQAIQSRARLLILDEPMSGLDPIGRKEISELMMQLNHEGQTIFFSTHILNDAQQLCDRVAFLKQGRLHHIYAGDSFISSKQTGRILHVGNIGTEILEALQSIGGISVVHKNQGSCMIETSPSTNVWQLLSLLQQHHCQLYSLALNPKSFEEYL